MMNIDRAGPALKCIAVQTQVYNVRKHDVTKEIVPRPFGSLTKPTVCEFVPFPLCPGDAAASENGKVSKANIANNKMRR
jgi:hypothetical protein